MVKIVFAAELCALSLTSASALGAAEEARSDSYFGTIGFQSFAVKSETITHPVDFSIDEIDLSGGAHITLYYGVGLAEQDDAKEVTKQNTSTVNGKISDVYIGKSPRGTYFDVHFTSNDKWGWPTQMFGYLRNKDDAKQISEFVSAMQSCNHTSLKTECGTDFPLRAAGAFLSSLKLDSTRTGGTH
jgi:hypothetical protein